MAQVFRTGDRDLPTYRGTGDLAGTLFEPGQRASQDWQKWSEREHATLALYGDGQGRIPDEAAVQLGRDFMVIRPACAILHKQGLLRETGVRRKARRRSAAELVITEKGREVLLHLQARPSAA